VIAPPVDTVAETEKVFETDRYDFLSAGWLEITGASTTTNDAFDDVLAAEGTRLTVLLTSTVYVPPSLAPTGFNRSDELVAPEIAVPSFFHW
jgi:hypothetical protein